MVVLFEQLKNSKGSSPWLHLKLKQNHFLLSKYADKIKLSEDNYVVIGVHCIFAKSNDNAAAVKTWRFCSMLSSSLLVTWYSWWHIQTVFRFNYSVSNLHFLLFFYDMFRFLKPTNWQKSTWELMLIRSNVSIFNNQ